MIPEEAQIRNVVRTIWSTQLDLDLDPDPVLPTHVDPPMMTAAIHITGDFSGMVRLVAGRSLVRRAAAVMFSVEADRLTADDERDALGELANIVAGNIKALLPGTSSISLPTLVEGTDYTVSTTDVRASRDYGFGLAGDPFVVTIIEHTVGS